MKKTAVTTFFLLLILLTSCSVYEDIYFLENGKMKYDMTIDASEMMSLVGQSSLNSSTSYPKDSIINFSQIVKDTLDNIPPEIEQDLKNIEPIYMRIQNNDSLGILKISIYGDFDNMEAFAEAFKSMSKIESQVKSRVNNPANKFSLDNLFSRNSFSWDGTSFKRSIILPEKNEAMNEDEDSAGNEESINKVMDESISRLFSQGNMVVKYHFPKKIKSINNENATFSMDGKTAILNYPARLFIEPSDALSINIVTE